MSPGDVAGSVCRSDRPAIFSVIDRRNRCHKPDRGGVISFVRDDVSNVVHHSSSPSPERMWHIIQRYTGSIALCNWYFSPSSDNGEISSLRAEIETIQTLSDFILIGGDLNTHQRSWLRYSSSDTPRGHALKETCQDFGLRQFIDQPTRGDYLLDLVLAG